jgi:tRNA threonylcarbamoyladenosine biosynthesis protein TsaE
MKAHSTRTYGEQETRRLGAALAQHLRGGEILGLCGDLGSGKTVFVRGLAEGLGVPASKVRSPTFTLINEYSGGRLPLYHLDLYRMELTAVDTLALREYLYGDGVCVVEWWERLPAGQCTIRIDIRFVETSEREVVVSTADPRYETWLSSMGR